MGLFSRSPTTETTERTATPLSFFNTLGRQKQIFSSLRPGKVKTYTCGPTVYDRQHIGNLSSFVFADTLRRVLEWNEYEVKQVINFTDFGHLSSDADEGEDKMAKGLRREGKAFTLENMLELGKKYAELFVQDVQALNVNIEAITFAYASQYVDAQVALIQTLEEKGYTYVIPNEGVYFDVMRLPTYGELGGIDVESLKPGARVEVTRGKRHPADFCLWKMHPSLGWDSPWGKGFPGWHIECSAMNRILLGEQIDIHTGGPEHIAVHHNNEIAQSEAASGKRPFARFWLHRAWIQMAGEKIAKSVGNTYYLSDIIDRGFHPLALRYWFLTSHYRTPANFSWEALEAAQTAYLQLLHRAEEIANVEPMHPPAAWFAEFTARINDDLDTPRALASVWDLLKDKNVSAGALRGALGEVDAVCALQLFKPDQLLESMLRASFGTRIALDALPSEISMIIREREVARNNKEWARADELREQLRAQGYELEDTASGVQVVQR